MAVVVWISTGLALWHFSIFVPEKFWQGIIGALIGALIGGLVSGFLIMTALGHGVSDTNFATFLAAFPGTVAGMAVIYWLGVRSGDPELEI